VAWQEGAVPARITDDILFAARRGDGDAFAVIWRELSPVVAGYLAARGVDDPEAVTSDVFLSLLPRLGELDGGVSGLRTFVFSVAHARAVDEARRRARRPAPVPFDPTVHDTVAESAEGEALDRVGTGRVRQLLDRLSPDHRDVLALRVIGDLGVEQTAAVMGRSAGSVKQLQRRALLALRAELALDGVTGAAASSITEVPVSDACGANHGQTSPSVAEPSEARVGQ
jgi:RNA polymerase sigma-70 factor (ECF subfamily)